MVSQANTWNALHKGSNSSCVECAFPQHKIVIRMKVSGQNYRWEFVPSSYNRKSWFCDFFKSWKSGLRCLSRLQLLRSVTKSCCECLENSRVEVNVASLENLSVVTFRSPPARMGWGWGLSPGHSQGYGSRAPSLNFGAPPPDSGERNCSRSASTRPTTILIATTTRW